MFFVRGYPQESQEMVFDAHDRAFTFFKGACQRGIRDSTSSVWRDAHLQLAVAVLKLRCVKPAIGRKRKLMRAWSVKSCGAQGRNDRAFATLLHARLRNRFNCPVLLRRRPSGG
jgi:hypothetical protein